MGVKLIDNRCGILKNETTAFSVVQKYILKANIENQPISVYIISNLKFFSSFQLLLPELRKLFNKKLLRRFFIIISSPSPVTQKEFLFDLKNDSIVLEGKDFSFLEILHQNQILKFKVNYKDNINTLLYIIDYKRKKTIFSGTASFSHEYTEYPSIDLLTKVVGNKKLLQSYLVFFRKLWRMSESTINGVELIEYFKKFSSFFAIKLPLREFIASLLKRNKKEYLVKNISSDFSQISEFQNMSYYSCIEKMEKYGGAIFSNSIGFSEVYLACLIIKYYYEKNQNSIIITAPENRRIWEKNLKTVGLNREYVDFINRKELQADVFEYRQYGNKNLIVVDEAEYFSIAKDQNNRKKHFEKLLQLNPDAYVLMISKRIINDSLTDLVYVGNIFQRGKYAKIIEEKGVASKIKILERHIQSRVVNNETIGVLRDILDTFMVQLEWGSLDSYYDQSQTEIAKPQIITVKYAYLHEISVSIYEKLIPTIKSLNFEYTKLKFSLYYEETSLTNWYKWRLYRKIESSLYAFITTCEIFQNKTKFVLDLIQNRAEEKSGLLYFTKNQISNIKHSFFNESLEVQQKILKNLESDVEQITILLEAIYSIKYLGNKDEKITNLLKIINTENKPTIIFSESDETLIYLRKRLLEYGNFKMQMILGENATFDGEDPLDKQEYNIEEICNDFEKGEFPILLANDNIPEEIKLPRAKVIINFDIPNIPFILSKRNRKASLNPNINKSKIYNFQSDKRVDKEIELFEALQLDVADIISYFGLDFVEWCVNEKGITNISNDSLQILSILTKDYKDFLTKKNMDEIKYKFFPALSNEDVVLRKFIKHLSISSETLKLSTANFKKPIYTVLKSDHPFYYVVYLTDKELKVTGEIQFVERESDGILSMEEVQQIEEKINRFLDKGEKLLMIFGIICYTNKDS